MHYIYANAWAIIRTKTCRESNCAIGYLWSDQTNVVGLIPCSLLRPKKVRKGLIRCNLWEQFIYGSNAFNTESENEQQSEGQKYGGQT